VLPAAMNASSKTKKCHYLGSTQTHKHSGMDVVNAAIDKVYRSTNRLATSLLLFTYIIHYFITYNIYINNVILCIILLYNIYIVMSCCVLYYYITIILYAQR